MQAARITNLNFGCHPFGFDAFQNHSAVAVAKAAVNPVKDSLARTGDHRSMAYQGVRQMGAMSPMLVTVRQIANARMDRQTAECHKDTETCMHPNINHASTQETPPQEKVDTAGEK